MNPWDSHKYAYRDDIPTMISAEERRYLHWLTATQWRGRGHVVEMGPWLGGSTACLADGMADNPARGNLELHVYDSFVWREFMAARMSLPISVGDSFESFFRKNLTAHRGFVHSHRASLPDEQVDGDAYAASMRDAVTSAQEPVTWPGQEPVEILFVDGAKSWTGLRELLAVFGPHLVQGALVSFQDYMWWGAFWVPVAVEYLADRFEMRHHLRSNTVTFALDRALSADDIERLPAWDTLDPGECARLTARAAKRLEDGGDPAGAAIVRLGTARMWLQKGYPDRARETIVRSESTWPLFSPDTNLLGARSWFEESTGEPLPRSRRTRLRRALRRAPGIRRRFR